MAIDWCKWLGHDGPRWLDSNHQGHCRRCRQPHPDWLRSQEMQRQLREAAQRPKGRAHPADCHAPCCDLGGYLM